MCTAVGTDALKSSLFVGAINNYWRKKSVLKYWNFNTLVYFIQYSVPPGCTFIYCVWYFEFQILRKQQLRSLLLIYFIGKEKKLRVCLQLFIT